MQQLKVKEPIPCVEVSEEKGKPTGKFEEVSEEKGKTTGKFEEVPEEKLPVTTLNNKGISIFRSCNTSVIANEVLRKIISEKLYDNLSKSQRRFEVLERYSLLNLDELSLLELLRNIDGEIFQHSQENILIFADSVIYEIVYSTYTDMTIISVVISSDSVDSIKESVNKLEKLFFKYIGQKRVFCDLRWLILGRECGIDTRYIREELNDIIYEEAYPYLNLNDLISSYLKNDEPVLILTGSPGTGKTRLIRHILKQVAENKSTKKNGEVVCSVMYSCHPEVVEHGTIFIDFLVGDYDVLVLEDIDNHLRPRSEGNNTMYNLLSVSNGLIVSSMTRKKIILSTNLPKVDKIDEALKRPGRCHSIVNTRKLSINESNKFLSVAGYEDLVGNISDKKEFALSELYHLIKYNNISNIQERHTGFEV